MDGRISVFGFCRASGRHVASLSGKRFGWCRAMQPNRHKARMRPADAAAAGFCQFIDRLDLPRARRLAKGLNFKSRRPVLLDHGDIGRRTPPLEKRLRPLIQAENGFNARRQRLQLSESGQAGIGDR